MSWIIKFPSNITAELDKNGWKITGSPSLRRLLEIGYDPRNVCGDIPDPLKFLAERVVDELGGQITKRDEHKPTEESYFEPIY